MLNERLASVSGESIWSRFPNIGLIRPFIARRAKEILHSEQEKKKDKPDHFEVMDLFAEVISILKEELEQKGSELTPAERKRFFKRVERLVRTQVESVLSEHLEMPFQYDFAEVDLLQFATDNTLHIFHPKYRDRIDLRTYFKRSEEFASQPEHKKRFSRELAQYDQLYDRIWEDLTKSNEDGNTFSSQNWVETKAGEILSHQIASQLKVENDEVIFVSQKHSLVMPRNENIYREGMGFLYIYQLVYLPKQKRCILVMNGLYRDISPEKHFEMLRSLSQDPIDPLDQDLSEDELEEKIMETVVTLPPELQDSQVTHIFLELLKGSRSKRKNAGFVEQDKKEKRFADSASNISKAVALLTQVLVTEFFICQKYPQAFSGLALRFKVLAEMVFHPLFSYANKAITDNIFQFEATKEAYLDTFLRDWIDKDKKAPIGIHKLETPTPQLEQKVENLQREVRFINKQEVKTSPQRQQAFAQLSRTYPNIFQEVYSKSICYGGSVGGTFNKMMSISSGESFSQIRSRADLIPLIGKERADLATWGQCRFGKKCENYQDTFGILPDQFVGECQVCFDCEAVLNGVKKSRHDNKNIEDAPSLDNLERWYRKGYGNGADAREGLQGFLLHAGDLPGYFVNPAVFASAVR